MKSYPDSVRFLYALGNEIKAVKFGLDTIGRVLNDLGNPQQSCRFVHVAGTNGKGSACAMIESGLRAAGVRTGLYTSPHLIEPTERIRINGVAISSGEFSAAFDAVHECAERLIAAGAIDHHPTYFETVTAMGLLLFRAKGVEMVVLEVGLGGRLDATNIVTPEVSVIMPVDFDHESYLGNTIEAIAAEKAGILKPGVPAVMAPQRPEAEQVIRARAEELGCPLIRASDHWPTRTESTARGNTCEFGDLRVECPFPGEHQIGNAAVAGAVLRQLGVPPSAIAEGIAQARWPGRLEFVATSPDIILDGAHNPAGARALAAYIEHFHAGRKIWLIYGTMRDKSVGEIIETLFPLATELILTAPDSTRALDPAALARSVHHPRTRVIRKVGDAIAAARAEAAPGDVIFISGSLFVVGEARALLVQ